MAKNKISILVLCLVLWWNSVSGQLVLEKQPVFPATTELREKIVKLAESQLYVRERTGRNDGKEVEMYLRSVDRKRGDAWCAAFMSWLHIELNIPNPESGWSPSWFTGNVVFRKYEKRIVPFVSRAGQVVGFWIPAKGRIGHVGMIESENKLHYITIEGNTNGLGSDEGDGVYRKIRKKETVYAISDFVGWKEYLAGVKQVTKKK